MKQLALCLLFVCASYCGAVQRWDFDDLANGSLPQGWKVEATGQERASAHWQIEQDGSAPLAPGVLRLTATNHAVNGVFNLCWTDTVSFKEGEIAVFLKAHSGKLDQGGGPIWRVQDRNNYYIARYNPLERNVSFYYTKNGKRITLAYSGIVAAQEEWNLLKIQHRGKQVRVYLNGELKLRVNAGDYLPEAGGVGLWTKADAATAFDDFTVITKGR